jgi:superfamily II DNA/RNA helicase
VESLHGDKDQAERTISMRKFSKSEDTAILVATDIASRGLDVKDIRTVINYDVAKNIETYVHRIGRTGT